MRTSAWIRLVVWSVALVALVAIFVLALCYPGLFPGQFFRFITGGSISYEDSELYTVGGGAVQAYGIKEIEINWTAGNVRIEAAEGREITMEEQGAETARDEMRYLLRDGKLIIQYSAPRRGFDFWRAGEKQLVVKVPQTLVAVGLDKFTVNAGSAWVYVDGVGAQDTKISFVSGHVELADMQCGVLSLDGVSGAVSGTELYADTLGVDTVSGGVTLGGVFGQVAFDGVSGGMELDCNIRCPDSIVAESVSGDLLLRLPENQGFTVRHDSVSGNFQCEFPVLGDKDEAVYNDGGAEIRLSTISGAIVLEKIPQQEFMPPLY